MGGEIKLAEIAHKTGHFWLTITIESEKRDIRNALFNRRANEEIFLMFFDTARGYRTTAEATSFVLGLPSDCSSRRCLAAG